jgi:hypothetical protein|tara:strand:- start:1266 stop:1439 length:174 start_codon:yes stop_codon:yes gene_type:complete
VIFKKQNPTLTLPLKKGEGTLTPPSTKGGVEKGNNTKHLPLLNGKLRRARTPSSSPC